MTIASDYPSRAYENDEVRVETNMRICRKNDEEEAVNFFNKKRSDDAEEEKEGRTLKSSLSRPPMGAFTEPVANMSSRRCSSALTFSSTT